MRGIWVFWVLYYFLQTIAHGLWCLPRIWWRGPTGAWFKSVNRANLCLVVLLHGADTNWMAWEYQKARYRDLFAGADVYAPFLKHHFNGPLPMYSTYTAEIVKKWAFRNPRGRIFIVGFSNGGRVGMYIESHLPNKTVRVVTIGAPINGTDAVNRGTVRERIARHKMGDAFVDDLQKNAQPAGVRPERYVHVASDCDEFCSPPARCGFPENAVQIVPLRNHPALMASNEVRDLVQTEYLKFRHE